jgi:hypothetical protein
MLHLELQILRFAKEFALVHLSKLKFSLFLNRNELRENILINGEFSPKTILLSIIGKI